MALKDTVDDCQAQTNTFSVSFGREERLEEMRKIFCRNAASRVGNIHANAARSVSRDGKLKVPAGRHCLDRIDEQCDQGLLDLAFIA